MKVLGVVKKRRVIHPRLEEGVIYGFFDGTSQLGMCGAGVLFCIRNNHSIRIMVSLGSGNGLKAEILALRCLLWFARRRGFLSLTIFGNCQVTVNWFNAKHNINAITLEPWTEEIRSLSASFDSIIYHHIYREANAVTDQLSKVALGPINGCFHFSEILDSVVVDQGNLLTF